MSHGTEFSNLFPCDALSFLNDESLVQARINLKRLSHFFFISEVKPSPLGDDMVRDFLPSQSL